MDPKRFRARIEGLNQALDNHGAFTALVPDWLWDGYKGAKTYTKYRIEKFGVELLPYRDDDGRKRRNDFPIAIAVAVMGDSEGQEYAMPVEYLLHEHSSLDLRPVEPAAVSPGPHCGRARQPRGQLPRKRQARRHHRDA